MRGHLQCRDTLAGNEGCPLKTGTTVASCKLKYIAKSEIAFADQTSYFILAFECFPEKPSWCLNEQVCQGGQKG